MNIKDAWHRATDVYQMYWHTIKPGQLIYYGLNLFDLCKRVWWFKNKKIIHVLTSRLYEQDKKKKKTRSQSDWF